MKMDVWVWNSGDYPGVQQNDSLLPIGRIWLKTHESSSWYTQGQISDFMRIYAEQGIDFAAWSVPVGRHVNDTDLNVRVLNMLRNAGIEQPKLQLDIEVEPQTGNFWLGDNAQLYSMIRRTKQQCPWAHLTLCMYQYWGAFDLDVCGLPEVDQLATMDYWNDFRKTPEERLQLSINSLTGYGKPIQFGIPGNAPPHEMLRGLQYLDDRRLLTVTPIVWRRGTTTAANWEVFRTFQPFVEEPPVPPVPPEEPPTRKWPYEPEVELRAGIASHANSAAQAILSTRETAYTEAREQLQSAIQAIDIAGGQY